MKFTVATKPLCDSLNLAVVNQNVSKFDNKSSIAELTVVGNQLRINLQTESTRSEIELVGSCDVPDANQHELVNCVMLKQLISTLDSTVVDIEFVEGGIIVHSGKSKFTLPRYSVVDYLTLSRPDDSTEGAIYQPVDVDGWKFIKDHQMYAISMSFINRIYTRVWVGSNGDVIVGDLDNNIFTHSEKASLGTTCLLRDSAINLLNSLPEGAKIAQSGKDFIIHLSTDAYQFKCQFTPEYENENGVSTYNAEMIMSLMSEPNQVVSVSLSTIRQWMGQIDLLSTETSYPVSLSISGNVLRLESENVKHMLEIQNPDNADFEIKFNAPVFKSLLNSYSDDKIAFGPSIREETGELIGVVFFSDELTSVLAGLDI